MTGIHQRTAPTKINRADWNDLVTFLGGTSDDLQIDATKILLAQGGSLLSTWRYASDLTKMDAAKVAGNIAAAQMQTNVLAAITAADGIVNANVNAAAAITRNKFSITSTINILDADVSLPANTSTALLTRTISPSADTGVQVIGMVNLLCGATGGIATVWLTDTSNFNGLDYTLAANAYLGVMVCFYVGNWSGDKIISLYVRPTQAMTAKRLNGIGTAATFLLSRYI